MHYWACREEQAQTNRRRRTASAHANCTQMQTRVTQKQKRNSKKFHARTKFFPILTRKLATTNSEKQVLAVQAVAEIHLAVLADSVTSSKHSLVEHRHLVADNAGQVDHRVVKISKQLQTSHLKKQCSGVRQL